MVSSGSETLERGVTSTVTCVCWRIKSPSFSSSNSITRFKKGFEFKKELAIQYQNQIKGHGPPQRLLTATQKFINSHFGLNVSHQETQISAKTWCFSLLLFILASSSIIVSGAVEMTPLQSSSSPDIFHIAAVFDTDNFTDWAITFKEAIALANSLTVERIKSDLLTLSNAFDKSKLYSSTLSHALKKSIGLSQSSPDSLQGGGVRGTEGVKIQGVVLPALGSSRDLIVYACDAIQHQNVNVFFVVGDQEVINTLSIATRHTGIPLIGYNNEKKSATFRGERPLYLQLDPAKSLMARALVRILHANDWHYASLITEDIFSTDGFVDAFLQLTTNVSLWRVEDHLRFSKRTSRETMEYKLLNLLENQSRVIILHCSPQLARTIFEVAELNGFVRGYAWFVTEDVKKQPRLLQDFPIGLVSVHVDNALSPRELIPDVVRFMALAIRRYWALRLLQAEEREREGRGGEGGNEGVGRFTEGGCYNTEEGSYFRDGKILYRLMKNLSLPTAHGYLAFDEDGVRNSAHNFTIFNLVKDDHGHKYWKVIGNIQNDTLQYNTILWPGNSVSGPTANGARTLRVVTVVTEPFVMEQPAVNDKCLTSVPCLRVLTNKKEDLDDIFKDFEARIHNDSRPYNVSCCQGLSIMLLERLARDLNFKIQLYITNDQQYGYMLKNGTWTGMVDDLIQGAAHMAVSAFSVTKARSKAIDFTYPYFYSGFAVVVLEQKRSPPIYAFMEPFDGWVWISIVCSATVVAVALSLLEWNSPFGLNPWGRKRKTNYTLGSGLNMVYAILFQHTIKTKSPKAWPSKWLQNFWAGASIFIYSSYTANLAAFLAGKNSGEVISGVDDPRLLEPKMKIGILKGVAAEDFTRTLNPQLYRKARRYQSTELPIDLAIQLLLNGTMSAYIDDTPVIEYARTAMDSKCSLQLIGKGFGEDAYAIGLPKNSWLTREISPKILEYHHSGFTEDLKDLFYRRSGKCKGDSTDGQLQGTAESMVFDQHAGLYLLLVVGVFVCVLLMLLEHATFKYLVPYWRCKPTGSFWKSPSMMFWSQRLHRIITSEQLVSPHHSAREMIEVMKNRDFAKLFQKSVRKQEKIARNRKNLFNVVEQLKWKNRPEKSEPTPEVTLSIEVPHEDGPSDKNHTLGQELSKSLSTRHSSFSLSRPVSNSRRASAERSPSRNGASNESKVSASLSGARCQRKTKPDLQLMRGRHRHVDEITMDDEDYINIHEDVMNIHGDFNIRSLADDAETKFHKPATRHESLQYGRQPHGDEDWLTRHYTAPGAPRAVRGLSTENFDSLGFHETGSGRMLSPTTQRASERAFSPLTEYGDVVYLPNGGVGQSLFLSSKGDQMTPEGAGLLYRQQSNYDDDTFYADDEIQGRTPLSLHTTGNETINMCNKPDKYYTKEAHRDPFFNSTSETQAKRGQSGASSGGGGVVGRMKSVPLNERDHHRGEFGVGQNTSARSAASLSSCRRRTLAAPEHSPFLDRRGSSSGPGRTWWGEDEEDGGRGVKEPKNLSSLSKQELYMMWKASERALHSQLKEALKQKTELQRRLSASDRRGVT